jgi:hypothetical protein
MTQHVRVRLDRKFGPGGGSIDHAGEASRSKWSTALGREHEGSPAHAQFTAARTLYAASGRLIPFNSNSPTASTFTSFSTFINTRGLMRI